MEQQDIKQQITGALKALEQQLTDAWECERIFVSTFRKVAGQHLAGQPASAEDWSLWLQTLSEAEQRRQQQRAACKGIAALLPVLLRVLEPMPAIEPATPEVAATTIPATRHQIH